MDANLWPVVSCYLYTEIIRRVGVAVCVFFCLIVVMSRPHETSGRRLATTLLNMYKKTALYIYKQNLAVIIYVGWYIIKTIIESTDYKIFWLILVDDWFFSMLWTNT